MARPRSSHPTDVELEILQVLWDAGPSALGELVTALQQNRPVAKTTVATMLSVMLEKKLVARKKLAAGYEWRARVSRRAATSGLLSKLLNGLFDGSASRLVTHLVESGELSAAERRELSRLLAGESRGMTTERKSQTGDVK